MLYGDKMKVYKKIKEFLSKYDFLVYIFLLCFLFGACFYEQFVYVTIAYSIIMCIFVDSTTVLGIYFFIYPFYALFLFDVKPQVYFFNILKCILIFSLLIRHIYFAVKNKSKCNVKILVAFSVYLIYLILPMHEVSIQTFIMIGTELCLIYILFQKQLGIDAKKVIELFALGIICSCLFAYLYPYSSRLQEVLEEYITADGVSRFAGLWHYGILAMVIIVSMSALCILKFFGKINNIKFVIYCIILTYFGLKTMSRGFLISLFLLSLVFIIVYAIKNKRQGVKFLIAYLGLFIIALIVFRKYVIELLGRISDGLSSDLIEMSDELKKQIFAGEVHYDPGRIGLWKLYILDIFSSAFVTLFGRGISRPYIGQMHAHNEFLNFLWANGIFGCIIYLVTLLLFIDYKNLNLKSIKSKLYLLTLIIPIGAILFIEIHPMGKLLYVILLLAMMVEDKDKAGKQNLSINKQMKNEGITQNIGDSREENITIKNTN